jgi:hypothetical protein
LQLQANSAAESLNSTADRSMSAVTGTGGWLPSQEESDTSDGGLAGAGRTCPITITA